MMQGANLRTNDVDDAIFRGADLRRAKLSLTLMRHAELKGARLPEGVTAEKLAGLRREPDPTADEAE